MAYFKTGAGNYYRSLGAISWTSPSNGNQKVLKVIDRDTFAQFVSPNIGGGEAFRPGRGWVLYDPSNVGPFSFVGSGEDVRDSSEWYVVYPFGGRAVSLAALAVDPSIKLQIETDDVDRLNRFIKFKNPQATTIADLSAQYAAEQQKLLDAQKAALALSTKAAQDAAAAKTAADKLAAEAAAKIAAAAQGQTYVPTPTVPFVPTVGPVITSNSPQNNNTLYLGLGVGAAALIGFMMLRKKKTST